MSTPNTTVSTPAPGVSEQSVILLAGIIGKRSVGCPLIEECDRTVLQIGQTTAIDVWKYLRSDVGVYVKECLTSQPHYRSPSNYAARVETCVRLSLHLHVGAPPLQNPLGSHFLLFEPISMCPSGQT